MNDHLEAEREAYLAAFPDLHFRGAWTARNEQDFAVWLAARRASSVPAIQGTSWVSVDDDLPEEGERVLVTRFAGRVGNPEHPGHPGVPWVEFTRYMVNCSMFECDLLSTGNVTHWARITAAPSHPLEAKAGEDA